MPRPTQPHAAPLSALLAAASSRRAPLRRYAELLAATFARVIAAAAAAPGPSMTLLPGTREGLAALARELDALGKPHDDLVHDFQVLHAAHQHRRTLAHELRLRRHIAATFRAARAASALHASRNTRHVSPSPPPALSPSKDALIRLARDSTELVEVRELTRLGVYAALAELRPKAEQCRRALARLAEEEPELLGR
jgi:hypothetical protein